MGFYGRRKVSERFQCDYLAGKREDNRHDTSKDKVAGDEDAHSCETPPMNRSTSF